ncbi:hypothetical protein BJY01DRAFT_222692 [Aspergillus pseudoustus]|uniref:Uncharacterized protein n=1 Tax=Aspergillus pseudoustus TaxID=1810923 RepID=A0ABR4JAE2_9EURO
MGMERALAAGAAKNIHTTTTRSISTTTASTTSSPSSPSSASASASGEPESKSPTEAPSKPATSSALAYIPAPLPADLAAKPDLTLYPIHPWDLKSPVPISNCQPLFYDAATQEYYLFTCDGAVLLHKTAPLTIRKRLARKFLYDWPSVDDDAVAMLASRLKIGKSEWPALVSDHVVVYHAVHDSVIVKRNSGNSGLFRFCVDKVVKIGNPGLLLQDVYTRVVRPDFGCVLSCECPKVYYCKPFLSSPHSPSSSY